MIQPRERLLQIARLVGIDAFTERFGPPRSAEPEERALRSLIEERLDEIARRLVEEAAASDDITDAAGAASYLEDRLTTLGDVFSPDQAARIRTSFKKVTAGW